MRIARRGSGADHGESYVELKKPVYRWDSDKQAIRARDMRVQDFVTDAHHDYTIYVPVYEFAEMVKALGDNGAKHSPEALADGLKDCLPQLIRLAYMCAWPGGCQREATKESE